MIIDSQEYVILVDNHDNQVGIEEKMRAHVAGLLHRAFSVFIFRNHEGELELLLQQRNIKKYHCGGLWTNTCCSHPREGEDIIQAGRRRLKEEMGITADLIDVGTFQYRAEFSNGLIEHEYDHVLVGVYNNDAININNIEVQDYRWTGVKALKQDLETNSQMYTPWFTKALEQACNSEISIYLEV